MNKSDGIFYSFYIIEVWSYLTATAAISTSGRNAMSCKSQGLLGYGTIITHY
jgi:hypothetical protein